ncbi:MULTISPECIES: bifunctional phosphopantothenoylcysteine decarboxylase/phosphopantothenate--cysteine ligase CoaBC [Asticcacaulis]|uniref:bifunctional phosphopantothenoylcysteine decarboxylase/phosphopantothenate--cysteine ligase CoaBC n=1 Tax=Asticcacaulis TaxID=76890 RepID=UPI001AE257F4|nr:MULTISPECIES: bifunctional phosphopantothenoylcysteine decarboxylase/phosphopantothenate--cysteine ligase CoaBC [Asticcacaulis]MBP2160020.1 phosphopantothenoylcysteine decarboxylase/phosphopantothenate--cysteine ligase [Asticcacaulis solisilvae]MDR6801065.1 phosphopantothenoylcysteine decarboxylase/phosphopantothenate--cysteine ligase [Asticcacaulis sp. BE141]
MTEPKRILLIIGGGIAAYKSLELIRLIKKAGLNVRVVLTKAAEAFVTPLTAAALSGDKVYGELFDLTDETEMGHIMLSRQADLVVVAPATANLMAKAASGQADDLATTLLLATDKPVLMAPAMNVRMWHHAATQRNLAQLMADGVAFVGPEEGDMACGEFGLGRMSEPEAIFAAILERLTAGQRLKGKKFVLTAGPTFEPLDPVRGLTNRSSGKQGYAIAERLAREGAEVTLVSGPVALPTPPGVKRVDVETAQQMFDAVHTNLPCDVFIAVAAVADWRPKEAATEKQKKTADAELSVTFVKNPDILEAVSKHLEMRPRLVVGFAAETNTLEEYAKAKLASKGCDAILANNVSEGVFGSARNAVSLVDLDGFTPVPGQTKADVASFLADYIHRRLS